MYSTIHMCQHGSTSLHLVCLTFYQHCCGHSCKTPSTLFHVLNTEFPEGPGWGLNREVLLSLKSLLLCHTGEKSTSATKKFILLWFAKINEHIIRDRSVDHDLCLVLLQTSWKERWRLGSTSSNAWLWHVANSMKPKQNCLRRSYRNFCATNTITTGTQTAPAKDKHTGTTVDKCTQSCL